MRATCRAAVAGLLAATAAIGTAQAQTPAPLDIRTGVYRGQPVTYEVIDGLAIVEGDIILGTPEELAPRDRQPAANAVAAGNPDRLSDRAKLPAPVTTRDSAANTDPDTRWPDGVVAYVIDEDLYLPTRVHDAIEHWEEHTSIRFVERTDESNWVNFMKPDEPRLCASKIGMIGGEQNLSLADECRLAATIHEIGHAVGLWHEQEREDRDSHVTVLYDNIDKRRVFNFMQDIVRQDDIGPYDYGSIMHYGAFDFSRNNRPTIETIPPGLVIGQRVGLSPGDIDAVSRLYGETPSMTTISTNPEGLDVEVDGMTFTTPQSFDWAQGTSHTIGVPSTQVDDTERFLFAKWSDGGDREHTIAASSATTVFTAHFIQEFQVETGARPPAAGTVTISPPSDDGFYTARTPIEVTADPAEGYAFGTWWGDLREQHHGLSGNPALLPSVPEDLNYTAIFTPSRLTTIDTNAPGRWAVVDDVRVRLPHNFFWVSGSTHTIAIEDEPQPSRSGANRWVFSQWSDGGAATHEVTVPEEPSTFKAEFKQQFLLTARPHPAWRGSVELTPDPDDGFHDSGSSVQLTAVPKVGSQFIAWLDENGERISHDNPMTLTMDDQGLAAAWFSELPLESTTEMPTTNLISGAPPTRFSLPRVREATHFTGGPSFTVEVPEGSASLTVKLETRNPGVDIDLYVRHGAKPELSDTMIVSDYSSTLPTGDETIVITPQSNPPLQSGTYFITFVLFETFVEVTSTISAVVATAPADQAAFDDLVVGQRMLSSFPASFFHVDFVEAGRFEEYLRGATNLGSYTYSNNGPDTGTVVFTYDAGNICTYNVSFASPTTGSLSYTCTEGQADESDWRLVDDPDYVPVTPPEPETVGVEMFSIPNLGGWSTTSNGTETTTQEGYGRIRADAGSTTPSGIAIIGYRPGGVLVAEAGVPASEPVQEGRIFAEVNGPVNTGLAIANPNDAPATIDFYFTDTDGARFAEGAYVLDAGRQIADFLNETPFNGGETVLGTFTFTSSLPIAVIALRGFTNRDGEFLMTTLPVAPLASTLTDTVYFPHFADGSGWATQVILVNPTDDTIAGTVRFLDQGSDTAAAAPAVRTLEDGRTGSSFEYSIPPNGSYRIVTSNPPGGVSVGSVRAIPDDGHRAPSGLVIFSFASAGKTLLEAGVPALAAGSAFRVYVESSGMPEQIGSIRTGLAIANAADTANTVTLEVTNLDGTLAAPPAPLTLPPSGQVSRFIDELFDSLPPNFSGVLQVTSTADVAIVGLRLRYNRRGELKMTTTPPSIETGPPTMMDRYFAHIVDSKGWSTQFILFSGTAGQTSSGTLSFIDTAGEPWDLPTTNEDSEGSASSN